MATIERRPLPPPNSTSTTITEADRAEIIARANDVIDYYLNGPGSYWDAGPRKPLPETINDLQNFKDQVIASKQFADDPNSIMDFIIKLIDQTTDQVEQAARNNEGRDSISLPPPDTNDPIVAPRVIGTAAQPISLPLEGEQPAPPPAGGTSGISSSKPVRILSRRIADKPPASAFDASAPEALDRQDSVSDRFGNGTSSPDGVALRNPNLPVPPEGGPLGIFSGKPMPQWTFPLPLGGLPNSSDTFGSGDWFNFLAGVAPRNPTQLAPPPQAGGSQPVRYLGRRIVDQSQSPAFNTSAPAVPLAPSVDANFSGGLAGRIAALAGIDPQNPAQPALAPRDGALRGFYRDDPVQPWFVQGRR